MVLISNILLCNHERLTQKLSSVQKTEKEIFFIATLYTQYRTYSKARFTPENVVLPDDGPRRVRLAKST